MWIRCEKPSKGPRVEWLVKQALYYADGTPKRGPNSPGFKNPNDPERQLVKALLDQYNDHQNLCKVSLQPQPSTPLFSPTYTERLMLYMLACLLCRILHMNSKILWASNGFMRTIVSTIISTSQRRRKKLMMAIYSLLKYWKSIEKIFGWSPVAAWLNLMITVFFKLQFKTFLFAWQSILCWSAFSLCYVLYLKTDLRCYKHTILYPQLLILPLWHGLWFDCDNTCFFFWRPLLWLQK